MVIILLHRLFRILGGAGGSRCVIAVFVGFVARRLLWAAAPILGGCHFDGNATHSSAQFGTFLDKHLVIISPPGGSGVDQFESIEIELPLEGRKARLAKVKGDNLLEETVGLVNRKGPAVGHKGNDVRTAGGFHLEQEAVEFLRKGFGTCPPSSRCVDVRNQNSK